MRKLFGGILMAIGLLIAGASGLCSIAVVISGLNDQSSADSIMSFIPAVAIFGGIPLVAGIGLIFAGRALVRDRAPTRGAGSYGRPPIDPPNP